MPMSWKHAREFTRCSTAVDVELSAADCTVVGATRDVSLNAIYLFGERSLPAGTRCRVTLFIGGRESGVRVEASGRVARVDPRGMAVAFDEVNLDGYHHLKQLVLFNALDPDQAVEEIEQHVGLRRRV
jgi:hypothetical protein